VSQPADQDLVAPTPAVLVLNGSSRTGSFNRQLAAMIVDGLVARDVTATLVDLADSGLPLFDADLNASDGQPPAAHDLQAAIAAADGLVIVSPEYNGAMTPLLKNTIDWVSRVDMTTMFPKKVALAAATPGRRGGASVLDLTSRWLPYMGADVFPETFGLPSVRHTLVDGQLLDGHDDRLATFLDAVASFFREPSAGPV
jgi:chromate reductase, NAD(P)H dehydrogenase (quinone)